ncbi:hypothetical protein D3C72_2055870 [compost metagenome]
MTNIVFGGWCKDRLRKLIILAKACRKRNTVNFSVFFILSPAPAGNISAHYTFDINALCFAGNHNPVSKRWLVLITHNSSKSINIRMNDMILHQILRDLKPV